MRLSGRLAEAIADKKYSNYHTFITPYLGGRIRVISFTGIRLRGAVRVGNGIAIFFT